MFFDNDSMQGFLASDAGKIIVVFRGTDRVGDENQGKVKGFGWEWGEWILTDFNVSPRPANINYGNAPGVNATYYVHSGFDDSLDGTAAGIMAANGKVYLACIPHVWMLEDKDVVFSPQETLELMRVAESIVLAHNSESLLDVDVNAKVYQSDGQAELSSQETADYHKIQMLQLALTRNMAKSLVQ